MPDLNALLADLKAEGDALDTLVAPLAPAEWAAHTPAEGWTIAHQIAHLAWTDEKAIIAATDAAAFAELINVALTDPDGFVERGASDGAGEAPGILLARWRDCRVRMFDALSAVPPGTKLPWFGPPMGVASMATARLMETWAHGQDVADTLGVRREPTHRLRHVAHIGVRTRDFAFRTHELEPPASEFRVALTAPHGDTWTWGPPEAEQSVTGSALDFCLLVTQRRNRSDLDVVAKGPDADHWLDIAQAFAGPPGKGRQPTGRTS